eukprot:TRINITY_DN5088_c0_g1_i13.p1 TRINITY_DN5088_c0_g1~~TRINITY_DN5088_c0_g1_i13.p1  ORF type:complete len:204 (-),score=44.04 TRINITY_DN5088_c0_g1_i13:1285-1815(-)
MFDFDDLDDKFEQASSAKSQQPSAAKTDEAADSPHTEMKEGLRALRSVVPAPLGRKMRILGLHGGGSNTNIMQYQVAALKSALGKDAEWDFLNGGRAWTFDKGMEPPPVMSSLADGMPFCGWYGIENDDASDRLYLEKLFDPAVTFTYKEVELGVDRSGFLCTLHVRRKVRRKVPA